MKSIQQIAEELDISTGTIREYLKSFKEFFPQPVEHEGIKEYPPETSELVEKIYAFYQSSGMTKEEIREKLGGEIARDMARENGSPPPTSPVAFASPLSSGPMDMLMEKLDRLTTAIDVLTQTIGGGQLRLRDNDETKEKEKLNQFNAQITEIIELSKENDSLNVEKNVQAADGTLIFSFGDMTIDADKAFKYGRISGKPLLHINLETEKNPEGTIRKWLSQHRINILHVAGRNACKVPLLKKTVNDIIASILHR